MNNSKLDIKIEVQNRTKPEPDKLQTYLDTISAGVGILVFKPIGCALAAVFFLVTLPFWAVGRLTRALK